MGYVIIFIFVYYLGVGVDDVNFFFNEVLIMKDFDYFNVLILIGIIMDKGEFLMVILFFMYNGVLLIYIRDENNVIYNYVI